MTRTASVARPVVLIGFAEAMAAIETAWSLQGAGFKVVAFRRSGSRSALRYVRGIDVREVPQPEAGVSATLEALARLCTSVKPAAVLPLDDHALWMCSQLKDLGIHIAGASGLTADVALDKSRQLEAARKADLPVPATQTLEDLGEGYPAEFPVILKPARALYHIGGVLERPTGVVCANIGEFERARARKWPGSMLVQPLIRGVGEGLFGHVGLRGVVGWSAHRRVRMVNPQGSASSACRSEQVDDRLTERAERFLSGIGWRGMFMLEFLRDSHGTPWFMELNGRPWGSMTLARRRGFEYPAWTVQASLEPSFDPVPPDGPPELLCRNLGLELVHLLFVARGPQSDALTEWPRLTSSIRDVCRITAKDRLYNCKLSQPAVLAADTLGTLGNYARKVARKER